ncbi:MAG: sensor histidine kinase [Campylobacterales bacterium]
MADLHDLTDRDLIAEIQRRFDEKAASIKEMEFMTKKLLELNERTKEAEAIKSQFLSLIKNEFNNPISSLLNLASLLALKKHPERFDEIANMLNMELLRLDFQLKNIFAATEIEAGEIANDYSRIKFTSIYEEVISGFRYLIADKRLTVNLAKCEDEGFIGDANKLYLILLNLISNACEFSYPDSKVSVALKKETAGYLITVEDAGEGIGVEFANEVYNRFTKFSSGKTRAHAGLGLGLSVVRGLVESLDGDVTFESQEGYTIFKVTLPAVSAEVAESASEGGNEFMFEDFGDAVEM